MHDDKQVLVWTHSMWQKQARHLRFAACVRVGSDDDLPNEEQEQGRGEDEGAAEDPYARQLAEGEKKVSLSFLYVACTLSPFQFRAICTTCVSVSLYLPYRA
jgi:hypothetical protein